MAKVNTLGRELELFDFGRGTLRLVHDKLVWRAIDGQLLYRCGSIDTFVLLEQAQQHGARHVYDIRTPLASGAITMAVTNWGVKKSALVWLPQADQSPIQVPLDAVRAIRRKLRRNIGAETFSERRNILRWSGPDRRLFFAHQLNDGRPAAF